MKKNQYLKCEKAQSITEFALVLPVIILILTIVVEVATIVDAKILLQSAGFEAAKAAVTRRVGDKETKARDGLWLYCGGRFNMENLKITVTEKDPVVKKFIHHAPKKRGEYGYVKVDSNYKYRYVTVALSYKKPYILPLTKLFFGEYIELKTSFSAKEFLESYNRDNK